MLRLLIASSRRVNNRNLAPLSAASSKKSPPVQQANEPNPEEHDLYLDPNDNQVQIILSNAILMSLDLGKSAGGRKDSKGSQCRSGDWKGSEARGRCSQSLLMRDVMQHELIHA
jgi:hypothetical protein